MPGGYASSTLKCFYDCDVMECKGAGGKTFPSLVRDLVQRHKIQLLAILEPRISGIREDRVTKRMGFSHQFRVEAQGFAGGIWLLWEEQDFVVDIVQSHQQFVHMRILPKSRGRPWFCTVVYGAPKRTCRSGL